MIHTKIIFAFILAVAAFANAQDSTPFSCQPPQLLGSVDGIYGNTFAITIDGDYAYLLNDRDELNFAIVDISDHANPVITGSLDLSVYDGHIIINNNTAYIIQDNQMLIVNIEDKSDPWFVRYYHNNFFDSFTITSDYVYPRHNQGQAINLSRPLAPGLDEIENPEFEFEDAPIAFLNNELITAGLDRYNIDNPLNPVLINESSDNSIRLDSFRYEPPYILNYDNKTSFDLGVVQINPTSHALSRLDTPTHLAFDFTIRGDLIYSAFESDFRGIRIDTLSPNPIPVATHTQGPGIDSAVLIRRHRDHFVIIGDQNLTIYDIPTNPVSGARTDLHHSHLELMGDTAILSTGNFEATTQGASVIDISDQSQPRWVAQLPTPNAFGIDSIAPFVFVADKNAGLKVFDLTDSSSPELETTYNTSTNQSGTPNTRDIFFNQTHAFVADRNAGLTIYEIVNTHQLEPITTLPFTQAIQRVSVQGDLAYVSGLNKLFLVDVSDPADPFVHSSINEIPGTSNIIHTATRDGNLLYTADDSSGYRIFDIADLSNPIEIAYFDAIVTTKDASYIGTVYDLHIDANLLYVAMSSGGLAIYENTNPLDPVLLRHAPANAISAFDNRYRDLVFRDNLLFTSAGDAGLRIFDLADCALPCAIDFNDDGILNFFDVSIFIVAYTSDDPLADLNNDGSFNFFDVSIFLQTFKAGCP